MEQASCPSSCRLACGLLHPHWSLEVDTMTQVVCCPSRWAPHLGLGCLPQAAQVTVGQLYRSCAARHLGLGFSEAAWVNTGSLYRFFASR